MQWGVSRKGWQRWFAWRPVRLMDGRWAWLETLERTSYFNSDVPVGTPNSFLGALVFRPVADAAKETT